MMVVTKMIEKFDIHDLITPEENTFLMLKYGSSQALNNKMIEGMSSKELLIKTQTTRDNQRDAIKQFLRDELDACTK